MAEHPVWKKAKENRVTHRDHYTWGMRWAMLNGKIRRFFRGHLNPAKVKDCHSNRESECARCGACCKILFECPYLIEDEQGYYSCKIHDKRPLNCRIYPMDMKDIAERDMVSPSTKCGYSFKK